MPCGLPIDRRDLGRDPGEEDEGGELFAEGADWRHIQNDARLLRPERRVGMLHLLMTFCPATLGPRLPGIFLRRPPSNYWSMGWPPLERRRAGLVVWQSAGVR